MSWEIFKQNMLRTLNNPAAIKDIDVVAEKWATEYDAAVKRGFDVINQVTLKKGNVSLMKQLFKLALQKGLTSKQPYDLVGEMGKGVIAYWSGATVDVPSPTTGTQENNNQNENNQNEDNQNKSEFDAVLVGGLDNRPGDQNITKQEELFKKGFGVNKKVKAFRFSAPTLEVKQFLAQNPKLPIFLFSAGCAKTLDLSRDKNVDKTKLFVIEPYAASANTKNLVEKAISEGLPAKNVYVGSYPGVGSNIVGATTKNPSSLSKHPLGSHWGALEYVGSVNSNVTQSNQSSEATSTSQTQPTPTPTPNSTPPPAVVVSPAIMNEFPIPAIPAPGAIQNIAVISNLVTIPGTWTPALSLPGIDEPDLREGPTKDDDMPSTDIGEMQSLLGEVPVDVPTLEPTSFSEGDSDYFNTETEEVEITQEDVQKASTEAEEFDDDPNRELTPEEKALLDQANASLNNINNPPEPELPKIYKNVGATAPPIPPGLEKYAVNGKNGTIPADKLGKIDASYGGGTLHIEAAKMYNKLITLAKKSGVTWRVSSTYRSYEGQVACWEKYGPGSAAKPGFSPHGWGLALDFGEICGMQEKKAAELGVGRATAAPAKYTRENSKLYAWLAENGPKFGWYNPYRLADGAGMDETWHWEYWGFYTLTKEEREA